MFCDGPGQLAAIQVTAALGIADAMIEWRRFDLEAELLASCSQRRNTGLFVPQSPGLGIDPDPT
jgi:hypothetical protein